MVFGVFEDTDGYDMLITCLISCTVLYKLSGALERSRSALGDLTNILVLAVKCLHQEVS